MRWVIFTACTVSFCSCSLSVGHSSRCYLFLTCYLLLVSLLVTCYLSPYLFPYLFPYFLVTSLLTCYFLSTYILVTCYLLIVTCYLWLLTCYLLLVLYLFLTCGTWLNVPSSWFTCTGLTSAFATPLIAWSRLSVGTAHRTELCVTHRVHREPLSTAQLANHWNRRHRKRAVLPFKI